MMDVVETEAPFDAQPVVIGGTVTPFGIDDLLVLHLIGNLAADAAIRAQRVDFAVRIHGAGLILVEVGCRHERAGRTGLHALAAGYARGASHRIVEVKHDLGAMRAIGHADDVVDLYFAAGAHTKIALDASIEIDTHRRMARIGTPALVRRKAAACQPEE